MTEGSPHENLSAWMDVNLDALEFNYRFIRDEVAPSKVIAVVKANGLGTGLVMAAKRLDRAGVFMLATSHFQEALFLRHQGISCPILVMNGITTSQMKMAIDLSLSFFAFDEWSLRAAESLSQAAGRAAKVHLKVDTGLGRLGFLPGQAPAIRDLVATLRHISLEGIASHIAAPVKTEDDWFTQVQYDRFLDVCKVIDPEHQLLRHFASSNTLPRLTEINADGVRPQCVLWGLAHAWPLPWPLKPVATLKARIVQVKDLPEDHYVGYSFAYKTTRPTRLAVVPVGVGDGLKPDHKTGGYVLVGGRRCPIIGVCSCEMMVDVTTVPSARPEDEVVLIGTQGGLTQDAVQFGIDGKSSFMSTLPLISPRIPRLYWEDGKCVRKEAFFHEV